MKKAIDILNEQINECDLKFTQKERLAIIWCIKQGKKDAIDECIKSLKIDYPDGYEKTLNNILKLKEEL